MLQKLVEAYARHLDVSQDYLGDLEESDGVYTFGIERRILCTISEMRASDSDKLRITIMAGLTGDMRDDDYALLEALELYSQRLRLTPLYQKGHLVISDEYSLGLSLKLDTDETDEKNFIKAMDVFVATVMAITDPGILDSAPVQDEAQARSREIISRVFVPRPEAPYRKFLQTCGIDEQKLNANFGGLAVDDDFVTYLDYHELGGLVILDNSFECNDPRVLIDLLYVNGMGIAGSSFEYSAGVLHLQTARDANVITREKFTDALLTQRFLAEKTQGYINDEAKQVKELNYQEIMYALMV